MFLVNAAAFTITVFYYLLKIIIGYDLTIFKNFNLRLFFEEKMFDVMIGTLVGFK